MSVLIYAKTTYDRRDIDVAHGCFIDLHLAVLMRADALMGSNLTHTFKRCFRYLYGPKICDEELSSVASEFRSQCDEIKSNAKELARYGLHPEDVDCLPAFVLDAEYNKMMSIADTQSFAKWLDVFINIESAANELGDKYPFADIPKCIIFDRNLYSDEDWEESEIDGISRLYDVVKFAAKNNRPLLFC